MTDPVRLFIDHLDDFPTLMTLATVGEDGYPRTRTVNVNGVREDGGVLFHTDTRSEKVHDIDGDGKASLTVLTADASRQVTAIGDAVRVDEETERGIYAGQPRYLQLLAWLNDPGLAQEDRSERRRRWAEFDRANPDLAEQDPPTTWAVFAVVPREYLFWEGDDEGPSHRVRYIRTSDGWETENLPG
ncbi:pyridoxamine 5'-phosphate oxidase family protein [Corynebacterium glyciniphilum]|uniref:pyridoxamine 5'-phosphate oxidase family protein n=1 Tax=Corynebacterium glyciniphilum TaxID=1404244 RepID=UPI003FD09626